MTAPIEAGPPQRGGHRDDDTLGRTMMLARRRSDEGFTLIELLVVVIIIGVLAAIAIPTFLSQRNKAWRTSAVADMRNAATAVETFATNTNGSYAGANGADQNSPVLDEEGFNPSEWVEFRIVANDAAFCIQGVNRNLPGRELVYRSDSGLVEIGPDGGTPCATL